MNNLDKQYTDLLQDILENGTRKMDRTGTGTISVFGRQIRHKMSEGFPAITTKKMAFKTMVTELLWFLRGSSDIRFLWENNCTIWDGDWEKNYKTTCSEPYTIEEVKQKVKDGNHSFHDSMFDMGKIYGSQWRSWDIKPDIETKSYIHKGETHFTFDINERQSIDQIANLINDLKTNPDSRRILVSAWNPADLPNQVLPPCHYGFQVYTRELSLEERVEIYGVEKIQTNNAGWYECSLAELDVNQANIPKRAISLMWNQRSVDTFLGLPFNIASYGLLLEIIAKEVNMVPDELIGNLGDTHLYLNHIEQAKEQIGRELTLEERKSIYEKEYTDGIKVQNDEWLESKLKTRNIPTRTRESYPLPKLILDDWYSTQGDPSNTPKDISEFLKNIHVSHIKIENYQSHPTIKAPLSN
jgi:thymidylate synthase